MKKLTISQGLRRRKKLKADMATQLLRLDKAVLYDQTKPPTFGYDDAQKQMRITRFELLQLEDAIAVANATTTIKLPGTEQEVRLTWVLRALAEIKSEITRFEGYAHKYISTSVGHHEMVELQNARETTIKDEVPDTSKMLETPALGGTTRSHPLKEIVKVIISSITAKEREDRVEALQAHFDALNDLLETANHVTTIEYDDQLTESGDSGTAPQLL